VKNYWKLLRNHPKPARFLAARVLMATGLSRTIVIRQPGYRLRFHNANLSSQLWIDPTGANESQAFFRDYLETGDLVLDIGANIGTTVLTASVQVGNIGRVVGVEAHPRTFEFLEDNVRLNRASNVRLINSAVGATAGTIAFSDDRRDDMNRVGGGGLEIPIDRLDALVTEPGPVALLKVDVEGYEKFVFEGATDVLRRTSSVYFEVSAPHFARFAYSTRDVLQLLMRDGFNVYRVSGPATLTAITPEFDTDHFENLVALRNEPDFKRRTGWAIVGF
jgi:FkbM family methyltransferase